MTFIDTSAIYALADRADPNHQRATECFAGLLAAGTLLLTHNYVLIESMALLQRRLGLEAALSLAREVDVFEIEWITAPMHAAAVQALEDSDARSLGLVDHASFVVMATRHVTRAFAFDQDFALRGFALVP